MLSRDVSHDDVSHDRRRVCATVARRPVPAAPPTDLQAVVRPIGDSDQIRGWAFDLDAALRHEDHSAWQRFVLWRTHWLLLAPLGPRSALLRHLDTLDTLLGGTSTLGTLTGGWDVLDGDAVAELVVELLHAQQVLQGPGSPGDQPAGFKLADRHRSRVLRLSPLLTQVPVNHPSGSGPAPDPAPLEVIAAGVADGTLWELRWDSHGLVVVEDGAALTVTNFALPPGEEEGLDVHVDGVPRRLTGAPARALAALAPGSVAVNLEPATLREVLTPTIHALAEAAHAALEAGSYLIVEIEPEGT